MIHFGMEMYGEVDVASGLFHVATEFVHLMWVPIVPRRSYIVLHGYESRRISLGLSGKSILFTYVRTLLVAIGGGGLAWGLDEVRQFMEGKGNRADNASIALLVG